MRSDSFKALVGSHNYNLNTVGSDKDYKVFFYPSFDDLYSGEKYSKSKTSEIEDIEYHDIRKLPDMLWKSNVNFLEVLFSKEVQTYDKLYEYLHKNREKIARMNLPYLYDACMGMFYKKKKEFERDLDKGDWKKVCKHVMAAGRIVDFLDRYANNGWNFENAIWYKDVEFTRGTLLNIKNCIYQNEDELRVFVDGYEHLLKAIKIIYKQEKEDLKTKELVYGLVSGYVMLNINKELQSIYGGNGKII